MADRSLNHASMPLVPSFLEHHDPDTLRYYLSINMPENHDTDFVGGFVEKVNSELIARPSEILPTVCLPDRQVEAGWAW